MLDLIKSNFRLIVVLLILAVIAFGVYKVDKYTFVYREAVQAKTDAVRAKDAAVADKNQAVADLNQLKADAALNDKYDASATVAAAATKTVYKTITKEVEVYVKSKHDGCSVGSEWVRLHNEAARGKTIASSPVAVDAEGTGATGAE